MANKNTEKALLIGAGITLACSGVWKLYDSLVQPSEPMIIRREKSVVTSVVSSTASSANAKVSSTSVVPPTEEFLCININTADASEFEKLHGIGESIAEKIVAYRDEHGYFRNVEEIMNVSGVGEVMFSDIKDHIFVDEPVYETSTSAESAPIPSAEPETFENEEIITVTECSTEYILTLEDAAPININTADTELLVLLPYVDDVIAEQIISLREKIGGFSHPYELLYVDSLTQPQVAEIIEYVTVG